VKDRSGILISAMALLLAVPLFLAAQAAPNFAGTWKLIEPGPNRGKPVGGADGPIASGGQDGFHPTMVIKQTAGEITIEGQTYHQDPDVTVYKLNGAETKTTGDDGVTTSKAVWENGKLVVIAKRTFSSPVGDIAVDTKDVYSLVNGILTFERTQTTQAGTTRKLATYGKATS
jgi:hypothetical protein